jgi:tRNA G10  N-methylase Trm11
MAKKSFGIDRMIRKTEIINAEVESKKEEFSFTSVSIDKDLRRYFKMYLAQNNINVYTFFDEKVDQLIKNKDKINVEPAEIKNGVTYVLRISEKAKAAISVFCAEKDIKLKDAYIYIMKEATQNL